MDNLFCSASGDGSIKIWSLDSVNSVKTINIHTSNVASLIFLKDVINEELLLTASLGCTSKIVNIEDGKVRAVFLRDEPIFKMEIIRKIPEGGSIEEGAHEDLIKDVKVAGCYWNSPNIKIWGRRVKQ